MTRIKPIIWLLTAILITACARIPVSSVELTDMLTAEGERMHRLNITLVNKLFSAKQEKLDQFIQHEYLPKYIEEFTARIPDGTDIQSELPAILLAMVPEVTERRNKMHRALEEQRVKLVTQLQSDYDDFHLAAVELRELLQSAADIDKEKRDMYSKIDTLSGGKIDLNKMETAIDSFITGAGDVSEKVTRLNEEVNNIIGNK